MSSDDLVFILGAVFSFAGLLGYFLGYLAHKLDSKHK